MPHAIDRIQHHICLLDNLGQFLITLVHIPVVLHTASAELTNRLFIVHGRFGQTANESHCLAGQ